MVFLIGVGVTLMYQAVGCEIPAGEGELLSGVALRRVDSYH
jgi:hypothetical protein